MLALVIAASLIIGFIVAAGMIGKESRRLSLQPRQPVWRLEEAAAFVEGELPFDVAANIDDGTMKQLLRIHSSQPAPVHIRPWRGRPDRRRSDVYPKCVPRCSVTRRRSSAADGRRRGQGTSSISRSHWGARRGTRHGVRQNGWHGTA